jgi:hypothetical protein
MFALRRTFWQRGADELVATVSYRVFGFAEKLVKVLAKAKTAAHIAQSVEHFLGKEEVIGSNPIVSTIIGVKPASWAGDT